MQALTKSQLAAAAGVHRNTLANWLKEPFMAEQLRQLHVSPKAKKLPAKAVKIICTHYVIDID